MNLPLMGRHTLAHTLLHANSHPYAYCIHIARERANAREAKRAIMLGIMLTVNTNCEMHSSQALCVCVLLHNLHTRWKVFYFFGNCFCRSAEVINKSCLSVLAERFNQVSFWVATEVVRTTNMKQQVKVITKFLNIAEVTSMRVYVGARCALVSKYMFSNGSVS